MANKYLNDTGLSYFWTKIKTSVTNAVSSLGASLDNRIDAIWGNLIEHHEDSNVATMNYKNREHIAIGDNLYRVTSPIASGEQIVVGTNVELINIGKEVHELNDMITLGNNGWTDIQTLSSPDQLDHNGFYHISSCTKFHNDFTDYSIGDFMGLLLSNNFTAYYPTEPRACKYGTLLLFTPRNNTKFWVIQIWNSTFNRVATYNVN